MIIFFPTETKTQKVMTETSFSCQVVDLISVIPAVIRNILTNQNLIFRIEKNILEKQKKVFALKNCHKCSCQKFA